MAFYKMSDSQGSLAANYNHFTQENKTQQLLGPINMIQSDEAQSIIYNSEVY